jgi:hypothetical protein
MEPPNWDVQLDNKVTRLTFDYAEAPMLATIVAHLAEFGLCLGRLSSRN